MSGVMYSPAHYRGKALLNDITSQPDTVSGHHRPARETQFNDVSLAVPWWSAFICLLGISYIGHWRSGITSLSQSLAIYSVVHSTPF